MVELGHVFDEVGSEAFLLGRKRGTERRKEPYGKACLQHGVGRECTGGEDGSSHWFEMRKAHRFILLMRAMKAEGRVDTVVRVRPFSKVDSF